MGQPHPRFFAQLPPRRRSFLVIHNALAGSYGAKRLEPVLSYLRSAGCAVAMCRPSSPAQTRDLVASAIASRSYDAVVAAGGDGTLRAVAMALIGTGMPLGLIPVGTGNVMAHEIGLGVRPGRVAECLMRGEVAAIHTSYANGEPFFLMVGAGFDGRISRDLDTALKRRFGKLAYTWPLLKGLAAGPDRLEVRIDGTTHSASWVVASVRRRYAGAFLLAPAATLDATTVQTVLFRAKSRLGMAGQLVGSATGRIAHHPDIAHIPGRTVEISSETPVPVQVDGEPFGTTPVTIQTGGPILRLIVPAGTALRESASAAPVAATPSA